MNSQARRERNANKMRMDILAAAKEIAAKEGFEKISIRKIAEKIEYTPSIVYHYFSNKDEIIGFLMQSGYKKLIEALSSAQRIPNNPEDTLRAMTFNYIQTALAIPEEFALVHMDSSPRVTAHTSILFNGASMERPAIRLLSQCIREINPGKIIDEHEIELTAQSIASATMGLALKLIVEQKLEKKQQDIVISYFSEKVVVRMAKNI
ncbi:MAG: TetR/AcrR family transcriptional regulator [Sphaerochaeta sp.]|nr:TetR/AcrR family transcriptional regulator [Sphaerochaeta sp.]